MEATFATLARSRLSSILQDSWGQSVVLHAVTHEGHKVGPEPLVGLAFLHLGSKLGFGPLELLDLPYVLEATAPGPVPCLEEAVGWTKDSSFSMLC